METNDALREYARLEYRSEDLLWLRATVKAALGTPRTPRRTGLLARRARPSHRPVACKGSPRRQLQEAASPA
ncbi:MAG TPA: hypothetical protein HA326_06025 [Thermoplasmata archaeon]|nr:hypothetical protein [Thermoplasmata archaeon]